MPKFEVFDKERKVPEQPVRLALKEELGNVRLVVVDDRGRAKPQGYILEVTSSGKVNLFHGLDPDYGLKVNEDGKVQLER